MTVVTVELHESGAGIVRRDGRFFTLGMSATTPAGMLDLTEAIATDLPAGYDVLFRLARAGAVGAQDGWEVFLGDTWSTKIYDVTRIIPAAVAHLHAGQPPKLVRRSWSQIREHELLADAARMPYDRVAQRHHTDVSEVLALTRTRNRPRFVEAPIEVPGDEPVNPIRRRRRPSPPSIRFE